MSTKRPEIAPGITVDRDKGFGAPVLKDTSVKVITILTELASGADPKTLEGQCGVSRAGIFSALAYASEIVAEEPQARSGPEVEVSIGVVVNPAVRFGKPILKGTRMDVATLLGYLANGESTGELMQAYRLPEDGIRNALLFASSILERETVSAQ
jgi:uncharacterized protein (DUF433 family)